MSGKSIQAAQRRRGPQPSIGGSHMLHGSPQQYQQHPPTQPKKQVSLPPPPAAGSNMSKMSIPEAIMRMTYRLSALEAKQLTPDTPSGTSSEPPSTDMLEDILGRLELLENKEPSTSAVNSSGELQTLKQLCDTLKLTTMQHKNNVAREIAQLKSQMEDVRNMLNNLSAKQDAFAQMLAGTDELPQEETPEEESNENQSQLLKKMVEQAFE